MRSNPQNREKKCDGWVAECFAPTRQDAGRLIRTTKMWFKDFGHQDKIEGRGVSQAVSPDAAVSVSYRYIVFQMASLDSPQTHLSEDAIRNTIKWWFVGVETTRADPVCFHAITNIVSKNSN